MKGSAPQAVNVNVEVDVAGNGAGGAGEAADGVGVGEDFRWTERGWEINSIPREVLVERDVAAAFVERGIGWLVTLDLEMPVLAKGFFEADGLCGQMDFISLVVKIGFCSFPRLSRRAIGVISITVLILCDQNDSVVRTAVDPLPLLPHLSLNHDQCMLCSPYRLDTHSPAEIVSPYQKSTPPSRPFRTSQY